MDTRITTTTIPAWEMTAEEYGDVAKGRSVKNDILGKDVYNDRNENIGSIEDLLVTRDKAISYAIIGVGGFLGLGHHDVAVAVHQLRIEDDRILLPGATEDTLKTLPAFEYDTYR